MTAREAVAGAAATLAERGVESPRLDAELLLADVLGVGRGRLYSDSERLLTETDRAAFDAMVRRRGEREPVAYILGEWGFRRLNLRVDRRALIPRPETEVVVERCLALLADVAEPAVLDIGTGSGAIALAIADERPDARVTAIDVSADAALLAAENASRLGLEARVSVRHLDARDLSGVWHLVVSNPPYVEPVDYGSLQPEIRDWEPSVALVGELGPSEVAAVARALLRPGGRLVLEVGDGQADTVAAAAGALGYADVTASPDLTGRARVVEARWP